MTGNLYFAYGSNMDVDQMVHRQLVVVTSRGAVLEGYKLAFDFPARSRWLGGAADILEDPSSRVEGVLHALANDVSVMDPWEGGYRRVPVEVRVPSTGDVETAWTYVVIDKGPPMGPSEVYLEQMLKGARQADLSPGYLLELEDLMDVARVELGDHVHTVRALVRASKPLALEELAAAVDLAVDRLEVVLADLGRWGWVQANNEPPVFRTVEGKEAASPWVLR